MGLGYVLGSINMVPGVSGATTTRPRRHLKDAIDRLNMYYERKYMSD